LRKQAGIGGLLSYGINPPDQLRRAGGHVRAAFSTAKKAGSLASSVADEI